MVSRLNAIALGILLILLALLLAITLIKQPTPHAYGHAVELSRSTIGDHVMAASGPVHDLMRPLSRMTEGQRKATLKDRRFSIQEGKIVHA